jgi:long-chain acyl-CoA synthetase
MKPQFSTLASLVAYFRHRSTQPTAVLYKNGDQWTQQNWAEYYQDIKLIANWMQTSGLKKGSRLGLFSDSCREWALFDLAAQALGVVIIPFYRTLASEELVYILNHSECSHLAVQDEKSLRNFETISKRVSFVETLFVFERIDLNPWKTKFPDLNWYSFNSDVFGAEPTDPLFLEKAMTQVLPDDLATIVYTSGTTGTPKGVTISHAQAISEITEAFDYMGVQSTDISLSFLPYAHILGRLDIWGHAYVGHTLAFAESIESLRGDLKEIRPTLLIAVPRIFEKIYSAVLAQAEGHFLASKIFNWALQIGKIISEKKQLRQPISPDLWLSYEIAKRTVLNKITEAFGGRLRFAVSGGAPLAKEISSFFHACDILVLEGYGLTETTGAITVNSHFDYKFGSVGKPFGDVQIKIAEDGEILVHSKKVSKGYFKDPQGSSEMFSEDGWLKTGDIGEILSSGDLKITDRKKDLIKTAGGKYVAPQKLENLLKIHPVIAEVIIHGDKKKYIVALITLNKERVFTYAKEKNLTYSDYATLLRHPHIQGWIRSIVAETNKQLGSFEMIKRFSLLPNEFSVQNGELTPSLKIKRKLLEKRFHDQLSALYE